MSEFAKECKRTLCVLFAFFFSIRQHVEKNNLIEINRFLVYNRKRKDIDHSTMTKREEKEMLKTKLGISIALVGAAMYFLGALSFIPAVLLAGYVLIAEQNEWLKRQAAKMIGVVVLFGVLSIAVGWIDDVVSVLNIIVHWFDKDVRYLSVPANLTSLCQYIISLVKEILLIAMGIAALSMKGVKLGVVDKQLDKYMNNNQQM